ncbi:hypothetical protein C2845_PM11G05680 [Panicum miliaceum]|uniref:Myb/SANT-like domain-containing protein n=1 Tax=Panicum miliaceum TaxID=4540 RepID=A0A3L6RNS5_PANMI|nr:hypothetical protein C2845_PM11G05680 [Panicum miliaceum]
MQIDNGNCKLGAMSKAGWADIRSRFFAATGLLHTTDQFSNKFRNLKHEWKFCNVLLYGGTGLGRDNDGNPVADDEWWKKHAVGHKYWMEFRNGYPPYLDEMDKMFEHVAVDGSTSFVPAASTPIEVPSSDEEEGDEEVEEEEEHFTPISTSTPRSNTSKRASSTSTTARSPSKRTKSPAVRSADSNMTRHNELMSDRNEILQNLWAKREEREEAARTEHRMRVAKVYKLAAELGVSAQATPDLFRGVMRVCEADNRMKLFFQGCYYITNFKPEQ